MRTFSQLFLLFLLIMQSCGQTWITTQIDKEVFVDFPSKPEYQKVENNNLFFIEESDYIILIIRTNMNFEIIKSELDEYYEGLLDGMLNAATDSRLIDKEVIRMGDYEGREIKYTKDFNQINDILVTKRIVLIDEMLYSFEFWQLTDQNKISRKLFKSIVIK